MKVKLLARKGWNKAGATMEYSDVTANWLISHGYAEPVAEKPAEKSSGEPTEEAAPAPRRGRPAKAQS